MDINEYMAFSSQTRKHTLKNVRSLIECFGPHNIENCAMVKKAVKCCYSNNLKNDYESKKINFQDSDL